MTRQTYPPSRNIEIEPHAAALLFVDVQNYNCLREGGEYAHLTAEARDATYGSFFEALEAWALPNMALLQASCRAGGIEVLYTVIESLTLDGRDRSLDYKITGFNVPKGSFDAQVVAKIAPEGDEIVLAKTSSSVFISTNIDYVLRNLGVRYLMIAGCLTDQCVDSSIRDACDLGYLVTCVTDACVTLTEERHTSSLRNNSGYCRQITTREAVSEIGRLTGIGAVAVP
jgi:ureidoacrylate peracid hydrolase